MFNFINNQDFHSVSGMTDGSHHENGAIEIHDLRETTVQNSETQSNIEKINNLLNHSTVRWGTFGDCWVYMFVDDELYVSDGIPLDSSYEKLLSAMVILRNEYTLGFRAHKRVCNLKINDIEKALNVLWQKDMQYYYVDLDWRDHHRFLQS